MQPLMQMEQSTSKASLRGIHAVGGGVAWASGTEGTVLRTEDAGFVWQSCAMPPGAEKLDFRGVWAWDAMTAIVMSSGPGDASRLYKTTDGCVSWKLLVTNTDKEGFWDAIAFSDERNGYLLGDPVEKNLTLMRTGDGGEHWSAVKIGDSDASLGSIGFFAASNSLIALSTSFPSGPAKGMAYPVMIGTGSIKKMDGSWRGPFVLRPGPTCNGTAIPQKAMACFEEPLQMLEYAVPIASGSESAGIFSIAGRFAGAEKTRYLAVGGDYRRPDQTQGTAAWSENGARWTVSTEPPRGYRSSVAWDEQDKAWVTAGPNGSDYSLDDGKTWEALEVTDVKNGWNAISLPWFVGPNGRIGKLVSLPKARPATR